MKSLIYKGHVMHARLAPVRHVFRYPVFFVSLDLEELPGLNGVSRLLGYNRRRILAIHDRDYLDQRTGTLREKLLRVLQEHGYDRPITRIELITTPRYFNYVFNPVSFYCCYEADGSMGCLIAEVNNTFNERHLYVLDRSRHGMNGDPSRFSTAKSFHVSPFNNMDGQYEFHVAGTGEDLDIRIDLIRDHDVVMKTQIAGRAQALTPRNIAFTLLRYPITAALTFPRILWQSAKLFFMKKLSIHSKPVPQSEMTIRTAPPTWLQRLGRRILFAHLRHLQTGALTVTMPDRSVVRFGEAASPLQASLHIKDHKFFWRILSHGDIGLGESYMDGEWQTDSLPTFIRLLIENRESLKNGNLGTASIGLFANRILHLLRPNTQRVGRKNVSAHYDLSNDFFRVFLDPSMMYSCALYHSPEDSLEKAQKNKLYNLINKARISPNDHVLEIGSGWGAFAIEAVRKTNCRVTTITVSREQWTLARQRVKEAGLEDRINVELCDYRNITGQYDKIISIEMLEAVGHRYLGEFFRVCDRVLKPDGLVVLQVITIPNQRYEAYRRGVDWIQKHIFPGGHLPSLDALMVAMKSRSRFVVEQIDNIGIHYAQTLRDWRERFTQSEREIKKMGFDEIFIRKWLYYLSYCEAAFATRTLDDLHLVLTRR